MANAVRQSELQSLDFQSQRLAELHAGMQWNRPQKRVLRKIFREGKKRVFIRKGRKGGGTHTILYPCVRIAGTMPGRACYIIGPQQALQQEIVWDNRRLQNMIPKSWGYREKQKETRVIIHHEEGNSFIKIHGADNWKRMVGIEGDVFIFDELADHDPRAYKNCFPNIQSRDAIWIVVGAPPLERVKRSFYYQLEKEIREDPDWFFIHWPTWENADFLPGGMEAIEKLKDSYYRQGKWDEWEARYEAKYIFGGANTVLTHFTPADEFGTQVVDHDALMSQLISEARKLEWYQVYDPGFATCFGVLFACVNRFQGVVYLLDEIYEQDRSKLSVDQLWPRIIEKQNKLIPASANIRWHRIYDSAAPGFPQEVNSRWKNDPLMDPRTPFVPTFKEQDDEDVYFRMANSALHMKRMLLSSRTVNLQNEMQDYATNENGDYPDAHNHLLDTMRYLLKQSNFKLLDTPYELLDRPPSQRIISLEEELSGVYNERVVSEVDDIPIQGSLESDYADDFLF